MKILMVMDPGILIPPNKYGGIERIVEILAIEYTNLGHEVHLLVTPGSYVEGCTIYPFGKEGFPPKKSDALKAIPIAWQFLWKHGNDFDMVHNFGRLAYLFPLLNRPVKKIMSYQREITNQNILLINKFRNRNMFFTACSSDLLSRIEGNGNWSAIYNAIIFSKYQLRQKVEADAPLMFLGRIERIKGCHTAISVAKITGHRLIIAGNISTLPEEIAYFEKEIKPHIDGRKVVYTGPLNDQQKDEWLGISKALIFPIEWNEPFGIVMIEAMACGTPVIGYNRGSVNEVIDEGITGYKVNNREEMLVAVNTIGAIDRRYCREHAKKRFDASIIAREYLHLVEPAHKSIVIVTTGQPAANPRVVKEYEAFKNAGFNTKVLYSYSADWSYKIDEAKFRSGQLNRNDFVLIGGDPYKKKMVYFFSRILFRICNLVVRFFPLLFLKKITFVRSSFFLWLYAKRYAADLYIAHYIGALPAALKAAARNQSPVIFDAEDFHRGEESYYDSQIQDVIGMEEEMLPKVNSITTASPLISNAYCKLFPSRKVHTINNVFSRKFIQVAPALSIDSSPSLKLFWFSQFIGPFRGLETVIEALNLLTDEAVTLHLLGNIREKGYVKELLQKSKRPHNILLYTSVPPDEVFKIAAQFDIGLAAEITTHSENRNICLTNKIFTYIIAGLSVMASDTAAQKKFMLDNPGIGAVYGNSDPESLASEIKLFYNSPHLLAACKKNALSLATNQLNWENESEKLLKIVEDTFF